MDRNLCFVFLFFFKAMSSNLLHCLFQTLVICCQFCNMVHIYNFCVAEFLTLQKQQIYQRLQHHPHAHRQKLLAATNRNRKNLQLQPKVSVYIDLSPCVPICTIFGSESFFGMSSFSANLFANSCHADIGTWVYMNEDSVNRLSTSEVAFSRPYQLSMLQIYQI